VPGAGDAKLYNAITDASIPVWGEAHPCIPNLYAYEWSADPIAGSPTEVIVTVTYYPQGALGFTAVDTEAPQIEIGSAIQQMETDVDVNGAVIEVTYGDATAADPPPVIHLESQRIRVPVGRPHSTLIFNRLESVNPIAKSREYAGRANATGWTIDPTAAARTWRCNSITGSSRDGGITFNVRYEFEFRDNPPTFNWDELAAFTKDGNIPPGATGTNARYAAQVCEEKNFNLLALDAGTGSGSGA
jgi:hypothetical protein